MMDTVTVEQLKQTLANVLKRVGLGQWVTVLRHGRPVARLGPPSEPGLHVGARSDLGVVPAPCGRRLSKGAYLTVLADDRGGEGL
jgi:prevent-host-death family protein